MTVLPSFGAELSIQYDLVARSGVTPVPGGEGAITSFGRYPAIDSNGNVVFTAAGGSDSNGNTQSGVYTFIDDQFQKVVDKYSLIPGGGGATYGYFPITMHNDIEDGRVVFTASLNSSGSLLGIYSNVAQASPNDMVEIAVDDGVDWYDFKQPSLDGNEVAVVGRLADRQRTIMRWNGSDFSTTFVDPGAGYGLSAASETSISGDASIFRRFKTDASEMAIASSGGHETLVVLGTTPIPGYPGITFISTSWSPTVEQGGQHAAFKGSASNVTGIYKRVNDGALERVADDTMLIPGSNNQDFTTFPETVSLANGQVLFSATGPDLLDGIYTDIGGSLSVVVDDQDNNTIELDGQLEQITSIQLGRNAFAYTPQGYTAIFYAVLQSGGSAIIRVTIDVLEHISADMLFKGSFEG